MDALTRRNTEAVGQALIDMNHRIYEQAKKLDAQSAAISSMSARLQVLEQMVQQQRAASAGHGPSVR